MDPVRRHRSSAASLLELACSVIGRVRRFRGVPRSIRPRAFEPLLALEPRQLLANIAWDGGAGTDSWHDANNWNPNGVPTAADDVTILDTAIAAVRITASAAANSLVSDEGIAIPSGSVTLVAGSEIRGLLTLSGGTLTGTGDVTITNAMTWTSGFLNRTGTTAKLRVESGATLTMSGTSNRGLSRLLEVAGMGTVNYTGTDLLFGWNTGQTGTINVLANGVFNVTGEGDFNLNSGSGHAVNNAGTFTKSGAGTTTDFGSGVPFNNNGVFTFTAGTVNLNGGGSTSNAIDVAMGATLRFGSTTYVVAPTATLTGAGTLAFASGNHIISGLIDFSGTLRIEGATVNVNFFAVVGTLDLASGVLAGTGDTIVASSLLWTGGRMSGTGRTLIDAGAAFTLAGAGTRELHRTLLNGGNVTLNSGTIAFNNGRFENLFGATTLVNGTVTLTSQGGTNSIINRGTMNVDVTVPAVLGQNIAFTNAGTGTVSVAAGRTLNFQGTTSLAGRINAAAGASVAFAAGTHTVTGTLVLAGMGGFSLQGGTISGGTVSLLDGQTLGIGFNTSNRLSNVTVNGDVLLSSGGAYLRLAGTVGGTFRLSGDRAFLGLDNAVTLASGGSIIFSGTTGSRRGIEGTAAGTSLTIASGATVQGGYGDVGSGFQFGGAITVTNQGTVSADVSGQSLIINGSTFTNTGTAQAVGGGTLGINATSLTNFATGVLSNGAWRVTSSSTLNLGTGRNVSTNAASIVLDGTSSSFSAPNSLVSNIGSLVLSGGRDLTLAPTGGNFTNSGILDLRSGSTLSITGAFTQGSTGELRIEALGTNPATDFGRVAATGNVELNGGRTITFAGGWQPAPGVMFAFVSAGGLLSGVFDPGRVQLPTSLPGQSYGINYSTGSVSFTVSPAFLVKRVSIALEAMASGLALLR